MYASGTTSPASPPGWTRPNGRGPHETAVWVMKIAEEAGEAVAAYIGTTGTNPRKGVTATADELAGELCDVVLAALVALATVTGGTPAGRIPAGPARRRSRRPAPGPARRRIAVTRPRRPDCPNPTRPRTGDSKYRANLAADLPCQS